MKNFKKNRTIRANTHHLQARKLQIKIIPLALFFSFISLLEFPVALNGYDHGFRFIRIKYGMGTGDEAFSGRRGRRRGGWGAPWSHDTPTAELNLAEALERTTKIKVHPEPLILTLEDERIFEFPILYLCEPGYWHMNEKEVENLREYFRRGGFMIFDDFRGRREWNNFQAQIKRVFPKKEFVEIPPDHPIWSVYYEIDPIEAPTLVSGGYWKYDDQYFTMYDSKGRMMMVVCYNQDIGDGWEWPDRNYDNASTEAFKMGINFIIWAFTH